MNSHYLLTTFILRSAGCYLSNLRFADDIVLMSARKEESRETATELERESKKGGLEMNIGKTKILNIRGGGDERKGRGKEIGENLLKR